MPIYNNVQQLWMKSRAKMAALNFLNFCIIPFIWLDFLSNKLLSELFLLKFNHLNHVTYSRVNTNINQYEHLWAMSDAHTSSLTIPTTSPFLQGVLRAISFELRFNSPTPTCRHIKLSRNVGKLVFNPVQLLRSWTYIKAKYLK